jgi:DNA-binding CsgD family transcriptional regulator
MMKIERIQISTRIMDMLGFGNFFQYAQSLELMNTFQYDKNNFLSLNRIVFKPEYIDTWEDVLNKQFHMDFVQPLSVIDTTVICIAKSTSASGFLPNLDNPGFWAIVPPIMMDGKTVTTTIICEDAYLSELHEAVEKFDSDFRILAISDFSKTQALEKVLLPQFTDRQREIALVAVKSGYYEIPKKISAEEIAKKLSISVSGFNAHLRKIEARLMEFFFT